jgi:hypothetical protein
MVLSLRKASTLRPVTVLGWAANVNDIIKKIIQ